MNLKRSREEKFQRPHFTPRLKHKSPQPALEPLEPRVLLSRAVYSASAGLLTESSTGDIYLPPQYYASVSNDYLTGPSNDDPLQITLGYLTNHYSILGLQSGDTLSPLVTSRYTDANTGLTHLYLAQRFQGLVVSNANLTVTVTAKGQILNIAGGFVAGIGVHEGDGTIPTTPDISAQTALKSVGALGLQANASSLVVSEDTGLSRLTMLSSEQLSLDAIKAELNYMATPTGLELVWNMALRTPDEQHWYNVSVDASMGQLMDSYDWIDHASYNVYALPTEGPNDGTRTVVTDPASTTASPYGWHDTNGVSGAEYTDTRGNNVFAQDDTDANNTGGFRPDGTAALNFDFPIDFAQAPSTYQSAAITNLFYWNNVLHDVHYKYGFTEAAGNFQVTNYTGQGLGNDAVQADAQDGSGTNNANFATPPDGSAPRMQMYLFTQTSPYRDGDLDNMIIVHEYGHGVSNRLTGGPANANALSATQSGGMGEGWSDFWGLMFTQKPSDTKTASYPVGTYVLGQTTSGPGIRRFPYAYNMAVDPLTVDAYGISGTGGGTTRSTEVHNTGEIWCTVLWDLNWLLIDKYGYSSNIAGGYTGAGSAGNLLTLQLVMDALKIQPANPSFKDARDAILQADQVLTGGANKYEIWTAFARRGMGYSFVDSSSSATSVTPAYDLPAGLLDPAVSSQSPTGVVSTPISSFDLTFSQAMDTSSFDPAVDIVSFTGPNSVDLKGQITGFSWTNSNQTLHITFNSQTANGLYTLVLGPQILSASNGHAMDQDHDGVTGESTDDRYTATVRYDSLVGQVTATVPANGTLVTLPVNTIDLVFNESIDPASLATTDLTISQGTVTGVSAVNATTARFTISGVTKEGTLTLSLAAGAVTDSTGNPMAAYSGTLYLDASTSVFPGTFSANGALGTLLYEASASTTISSAADTDSYTLALNANQILTLTATPTGTLRPRLEVRDSGGTLLASANATAGGQSAMVQGVPIVTAGTYTISILSADGVSSGDCGIKVTLNAGMEAEGFNGATNDTLATAQNLNPLFATPVTGSTTAVAAVVGKVASASGTPIFTEDFESGTLGAGWSTYSSTTYGRIYVSNACTAASGSYALIMDTNDPAYGYNLNEGVWTVNLAGVAQASLNFSSIAFADETDVLPTSFTGHYNGDGVAISADGVHWYTVWTNSSPTAWTSSTIDLAAAATAAGISLGSNFQIKFQQYDNYPYSTDGRGFDAISITTPASPSDYYSFSLNANEPVSVGLKRLGTSTATINLTLLDSAGRTLATAPASTNFERLLTDFVPTTTGTYYVLVTGSGACDYALSVVRNGVLSREANNTYSTGQGLLAPAAVLGHIASSSDLADVYAVTLTAGTPASFRTYTPSDGTGSFGNTFNPRLRLLSSSGAQLAVDDNSASDGRNALLTYTPTASGTYYIEVSSTTTLVTAGEYLLTFSGVSAAAGTLTVSSITPANGTVLGNVPTSATLSFSNTFLQTSLQAADLLLDGTPLTSMTIVDDHTATFTLPAGLGAGGHTFTMAAGAIVDLSGKGLSAFSSGFTLDPVGPRVISSSIQEGDVKTTGALTYTVTFDKAMLASNLDTSDFSLRGNLRNVSYTPTSYGWSNGNMTLTLTYGALPEDNYTLTLTSGDGAFEGAAGQNLDGEPVFPIPPNKSGDGNAGGNFVVNFSLDQPTAAFPGALGAVAPAGSQIYAATSTVIIGTGTDTDSYTLALDGGQVLTLVLHPTTSTLRGAVTLTGPTGTVLGSASAAAANQDVVVQTIPVTAAGTYTITVSSVGATSGSGTLQVVLNAAVESEEHNGSGNDTRPAAQNIDSALVSLGGTTTSHAGVLGHITASGGALAAEVEPNNTTATANNAAMNFTTSTASLYQLGLKGSLTTSDMDYYNIGTLYAGDVITITLSGSASSRGTCVEPYVYLYRGTATSPTLVTSDDDSGPGMDSLIYRYTVTTTDTYYINASSYSSSYTGTYDLGVYLQPVSTPPATGGTVTTETESNNTAATANNMASSFRRVNYQSHTTATIPSGDVDVFAYTFNAGDLVTVVGHGDTSTRPQVKLLNASGTALAIEDGTSYNTSYDSPLYAYLIPTTGTYYLQVSGYSGTGGYSADVYLSATTSPPSPVASVDYYAFTAAAADRFAFTLNTATAGAATFTIQDGAGNILASSAGGPNNVDAMGDFQASAAGTYYLVVSGTVSTDYTLQALRNAVFGLEPYNTLTTPQVLARPTTVMGNAGASTGLNRLFIYENGGTIKEINPTTGAIIRSFAAPTASSSGPDYGLATTSTTLLAGGIGTSPIYELNPDTGATIRTITNPSVAVSGMAFMNNEIYLLTDAVSGQITVLDYASGAVKRTITAPSINEGLGSSGTALLGVIGSSLYRIDPLTGATTFLTTLTSTGYSEGVGVLGNELFISDSTVVEVYDLSTYAYKRSLSVGYDMEAVGADGGSGAEDDYYSLTLNAGTSYTFSTATPADGSGEFVNTLNPALEIYDSTGAKLASDDNSASDGKNAKLVFTPTVSGTYTLRLYATSSSRGDYVLQITQPDLTLTLPTNATETDGSVTASVSLNIAPTSDLLVTLTSSDTSRLTVPASVTIPAGQTTVSFPVTIRDNSLLDGPQIINIGATATGVGTVGASITIHDNESASLTLNLPASVNETAQTATATLTASAAPTRNMTIQLTSANTARVTVPATVTLLAGQTSVSFPVTLINNTVIDSVSTVALTAAMDNWTPANAPLTIVDDDAKVTLTLPTSAWEGQAVTGTVTLGGTSTSNIVVNLVSTDTTELTVPASVTITAGQTSTTFTLTFPTDALRDGSQAAGVTATATGLTSGNGMVTVHDSNLDHMAFDAISGPKTANVAFPVTLRAYNIANEVITNYATAATLSATGNAGNLTVSPTSATFASGIWAGNVAVNAIDSAVVLHAAVGTITADSATFATQAGPLAKFQWGTIASPQAAGTPFTVTLTAKDANGYNVTSFNGTVNLSGLAGTGVTSSSIVISEVFPGTPDFIEFTNVSSAPVNISGWQVYIYDVDYWPSPRPTLFSFPAGTTIPTGGVFILQEMGTTPGTYPIFYTGENIDWTYATATAVLLRDASNQIVDFMAASLATPTSIVSPTTIPTTQWQGSQVTAVSSDSYSYNRTGNLDHQNSTDWVFALPTSGTLNSGLVIPFAGADAPISITPTTATFVNGVWTGNITVPQVATSVHLHVDDGAGHIGDSSAFEVTDPHAAPQAPALVSTSDTGFSNSDNITNLNNSTGKTLQFQVPGTIAGATVKLYADGQVIASTVATTTTTTLTTNGLTTLGDGAHVMTARQTQPGQTESADSSALTVTILTATPATPASLVLQAASDTGASNSDRITNDNTPTFDVLATPYFRVYRNGALISGNYQTGTTYTPTAQTDGTYAYTLSTVDVAGNVSALSTPLNVTIDTIAPTITVTSLSTAVTSPQLTGSINDNKAAIQILVNGQTYQAVNNNTTWSLAAGAITPALLPGIYSVTATITDLAGNSTTDSTANELQILPAAPNAQALPLYTAGTTCKVSWNPVVGADQYYVEYAATSSFNTPLGNSGWISATNYTFAGLTDGGTYFYRVKSRKNAITASNTWTQTSQTDFGADTLTNINATATPGAVVLNTSQTVLFGDNFEDGDYNGWTVGTGAYTRQVTNTTAAQGTSYSLTMTGGASNHYDGISHSLASIQPAQVNFSVRTSVVGSSASAYVVLSSGSGDVAFFLMGGTNNPNSMGLYDGSTWHSTPCVANTWYNVTLNLDWTNKKLAYYVNGTLVDANVPFRAPSATSLTTVWLYNYSNTQAWWDEISFTSSTGSTVYLPAGNIVSTPITSGTNNWNTLTFNTSAPAGTTATVDILNAAGTLLAANVASGTNLSTLGIAPGTIRLRANLSTSNTSVTPALLDWSITWDSVSTLDSAWSNIISSTQDATPPTVSLAPVITNDATPILVGAINDPTASIRLTINSRSYDAVNNANGTWTLPDNTITPPLPPGVYSVFITATDLVGNISTTTSSVTITTNANLLATTINDGSAQRSMVTSLTLTFDQAVTFQTGALALTNTLTGQAVAFTLTASNGNKTYTLTFPGLTGRSLDDGRYRLVIHSSLIRDAYNQAMVGPDRTLDFHRFFGDYDGDGDTDTNDYSFFRLAYTKYADGRTGAGYLACFDYDGNGVVDAADYTQFRNRLSKRI